MDHNPPETVIQPDTETRIRALANLIERAPHEVVAEAVELLRQQLVPSTRKTAAGPGRPRKQAS